MRKLILSLEDIELDASMHSVDPVVVQSLDEVGTIGELDRLDNRGSDAVAETQDGVEVAASLEAMAFHLRRQKPSEMGKLGARFANIAIEEMCSRVGISLEEMPISDAAPAITEEVMQTGAGAIDALKVQAIDKTGQSLLSLINTLTVKREHINAVLAAFTHRIDEVREAIATVRGKQQANEVTSFTEFLPGLVPIFYDLSESSVRNSFTEGGEPVYGLVNKASTVVSDLSHFLTEHTHLYKRLIKKQIDWICDHKDNILKNADGIDQFSFNPSEYQIAGSKPELPDSAPSMGNFVGPSMPGAVRYVTKLSTLETVFGYGALNAINNATASLRCSMVASGNQIKVDPTPIPVLTIDEIEARLLEAERGIEAFKHWSDMAYVKMWKDAFFETVIVENILKNEAASTGDRSLSMLAATVLSLIDRSGADVPQYAVRVLSSLMLYTEYCIRCHMEKIA